MRYTVLVYESPENFATRSDPKKRDAYIAQWPPFVKALKESGVYVASGGLHGPETATTFRIRDGKRQVQDGPYADTKEQLGGFFLIEVPSLDAALEWAARCPPLEGGVIEVRPTLPSVG